MASQNGFMIHFSFVHVSFGLQEEDADYACTPCTTTQSFKDSNPTQYHKEANDSLFFVICESLSTVRILPPISGPISPFLNTPCSVHVSNGKRESD